MFLLEKCLVKKCRPRACGAVPWEMPDRPDPLKSSPRLRGCSVHVPVNAGEVNVVPAPAGLFRLWCVGRGRSACRPRACGAVPSPRTTNVGRCPSSPVLRGCAGSIEPVPGGTAVVPAPAGLAPRAHADCDGNHSNVFTLCVKLSFSQVGPSARALNHPGVIKGISSFLAFTRAASSSLALWRSLCKGQAVYFKSAGRRLQRLASGAPGAHLGSRPKKTSRLQALRLRAGSSAYCRRPLTSDVQATQRS